MAEKSVSNLSPMLELFNNNHYINYEYIIGYEPAGLTVHPPPPPQNDHSRVGSFFSYGCLVSPKFFPKKKVDFVGDIRIGTHQNVVLRHNHLNPISTKLTSFDNNE